MPDGIFGIFPVICASVFRNPQSPVPAGETSHDQPIFATFSDFCLYSNDLNFSSALEFRITPRFAGRTSRISCGLAGRRAARSSRVVPAGNCSAGGSETCCRRRCAARERPLGRRCAHRKRFSRKCARLRATPGRMRCAGDRLSPRRRCGYRREIRAHAVPETSRVRFSYCEKREMLNPHLRGWRRLTPGGTRPTALSSHRTPARLRRRQPAWRSRSSVREIGCCP